MLEELVLGILNEKDMSGYEIKRYIETCFGVFCKVSFGSLYPALRRLEEKGLIETSDNTSSERKKLAHRITDKGRENLVKWLTSPMNVLDGTNENLVKVYFFDVLPHEMQYELVDAYKENNIKYLEGLMELEHKLSQCSSSADYYKLSTLYYGISTTKKTIEWCEHIMNRKPLADFINREEKL